MPSEILLSSAYLPPVDYFRLIAKSSGALIEHEENYLKQTYRNRCRIMGSNGPHMLVIPVQKGSFHKTPIKEIMTDNSRNWKHVHLKAIESSYRNAPYYQFYREPVEKVIEKPTKYLIDLNMELLEVIMGILELSPPPRFTDQFRPAAGEKNDYRYALSPKIPSPLNEETRNYFQVFSDRHKFCPNLSIIDLLFNTGPDAGRYLSA